MAALRQVVAIDIDEVLAYFIPNIAQFYNEVVAPRQAGNGHTIHYTASHFHSMEFSDVFGISVEETHTVVTEFVESDHFRVNVKPVEGSYEGLSNVVTGSNLHLSH